MSGKRLLDTSVIVAAMRGDAAIRNRLSTHTDLFISAAVVGELLFGAARSRRPADDEQKVFQFAAGCTVLACDEQTARFYARIKAGLAAKGKPVPENDIWIAASAMQYGLVRAARDEHFTWIDGLNLERW